MRRSASLRALTNETTLLPQHLIQPVFVVDGEGAPQPIDSMPGIYRWSIPGLIEECRALQALGIPGGGALSQA